MRERLTAILKQYWGYEQFREAQYEIIASVLSGVDTLALMPTGGGKSITYQLPTLAMEGMCIVVTPLVALMKDQVDGLKRRGISAVAVNAGMSPRKIDRLLDNCAYGDVKFLYVSPERLDTALFRSRVLKMNVSLIAVDEAHCISQWGYDFRPSYLHIASLRELVPDVPVLALTATATDKVARDIMDNLHFSKHKIIRGAFARPNLSYVVRKVEDKQGNLLRIIERVAGSGIVYVRKRDTAEGLCKWLKEQGVSVSYYHGGLPAEERNIRQDEWVTGKVRVMVATNAFGMGIDKGDVRFVVHYTMSDNLESYYQEAGRAGRDLQRSYAVLMVAPEDCPNLTRRIENNFQPIEQVKALYEKICAYMMIAIGDGQGSNYAFNIHEFCKRERLFPTTVLGALDLLSRNEYMTYVDSVDNPARVIFKVSRDELYKYKFSPRVETVVLFLLRLYNGLFTEFRAIDESLIAANCNFSIEEVHEALRELWRSQIIRYVPAITSPMIYMNKERLPASSLYIAPHTYGYRKEQMLKQFDTMISYVNNETECRSVVLSRYFGDTSVEPCGCCDICLEKRRAGDTTAVKAKIVELLSQGSFDIVEIANRIHAPEKHILQAVKELAEAERVRIDNFCTVTLLPTEGR